MKETSDFKPFSPGRNMVHRITKSTADKHEQLSSCDPDTTPLTSIVDNSLDSKKAVDTLRKPPASEIADLQNCFTNALNMALSSAPI